MKEKTVLGEEEVRLRIKMESCRHVVEEIEEEEESYRCVGFQE